MPCSPARANIPDSNEHQSNKHIKNGEVNDDVMGCCKDCHEWGDKKYRDTENYD